MPPTTWEYWFIPARKTGVASKKHENGNVPADLEWACLTNRVISMISGTR